MCSTNIWLINWYFKNFVDKTLPSTERHPIHIGYDHEGKLTYSWSLTNPHPPNSGVVWKANVLPFRLRIVKWAKPATTVFSFLVAVSGKLEGAEVRGLHQCLSSLRGCIRRPSQSLAKGAAVCVTWWFLYAHWLSEFSPSGTSIKFLVRTRTVSPIGTHFFLDLPNYL